jgi:hypothetical protein
MPKVPSPTAFCLEKFLVALLTMAKAMGPSNRGAIGRYLKPPTAVVEENYQAPTKSRVGREINKPLFNN